jgi:phage I-like protein
MFWVPGWPHNRPMNGTAIALCAALSIEQIDGQVPEWVHLLPAGVVRSVDGRGPYSVTDMPAIIAASMQGGKLVLDENHATDLLAPQGGSAPARAWVTELQAREDGIWGKAAWTPEGRGIVAGYRGISPAIVHRKDGTVLAIARASLTNTPNLEGLVALHSQEQQRMDFRSWLITALGLAADTADDAIVSGARTALDLPADATEAAIGAALKARLTAKPDATVALQSALKPIALAAGLAADADAAAVLAGVKQLRADDDTVVTSLQTQLTTMTAKVDTLTTDAARKDAAAFVDAAIGVGRIGLKPVRDEYIAMHMTDPARAAKLVGAMPILAPGKAPFVTTAVEGEADSPALLSQKATAYHKKLAAAGTHITYAAAVRAVSEGKAA